MSNKIKNKHLDLLAAYNRNDKPSTMSKTLKILIAPGVLVLVFAIVFASMMVMTLGKKGEIKSMKEEIEVVQLKIQATDQEPYDELNRMETAYTSIKTLDESIALLSELTNLKISYLQSDLLASVKLKTIAYDQASSLLTVTLNSDNVQNIEKYVAKLRKHKEYKNVAYTGYQQVSNTNIADSEVLGPDGKPIQSVTSSASYAFEVKITLDGKAGE